jgi:hypothetical protein
MSFNHWIYSTIYPFVATFSSIKQGLPSAIEIKYNASSNSVTIEGVQLMSVNSSSLINRRQYRGKNGKKSKMGGQISCVGGVILLFLLIVFIYLQFL